MKPYWISILLLTLPAIAFSATIHVPGDHPTIQQAIDAAANGDIVLVAPGTYVECIDFLGKAITVKSEDGPDTTTIDGNKITSVVTFSNHEGLDSRLEGFTITNGVGTVTGIYIWHGAGIYCFEASPTIHDNIIRNNAFDAPAQVEYTYGGGIYLGYSDAVVTNNIITENESSPYWISFGDGYGGGISSAWGSPTIKGNTITHNRVFQDYMFSRCRGGGIHCFEGAPIIEENSIEHNTCECEGTGAWYSNDVLGGGIDCRQSQATIRNNWINKNFIQTEGDEGYALGGGIYVIESPAIIEGNTIRMNEAVSKNYKAAGGGIYNTESPSSMEDNVIEANTAQDGGGLAINKSDDVNLEGNTILANRAEGNGGGIWIEKSEIRIVRNYILYNAAVKTGSSSVWAGGIRCGPDSNIKVFNCLVALNSATLCGGLYIYSGSNTAVVGSTITLNDGEHSMGGIGCFMDEYQMIDTIVWGNTSPQNPDLYVHTPSTADVTYCDIGGGWYGTGNIDEDPLFANPAGFDFRLTIGSPCIDAGDNTAPGLPALDFDGDYRIADGDTDGVAVVDMGADEFLTLKGNKHTLSSAAGGTIRFFMNIGPGNGNRLYVIVGGMTGIDPGTPLPGGLVTLPLNWDAYTDIVLAHLNTPNFENFLGHLNPVGRTEATLHFDKLHPLLIGETMHYAATCNGPFNVVTNYFHVDIEN
jgi:hypothetical protein